MVQVTARPVEFNENVKEIIGRLSGMISFAGKIYAIASDQYFRFATLDDLRERVDKKFVRNYLNDILIGKLASDMRIIESQLRFIETLLKDLEKDGLIKDEYSKPIHNAIKSVRDIKDEIFKYITEKGVEEDPFLTIHVITDMLDRLSNASHDLLTLLDYLAGLYKEDPPEYDIVGFLKIAGIAGLVMIGTAYVLKFFSGRF